MADTRKRRPRRQFTDEFKASAVRLVLEEGKTVGAAARYLNLTETALREWVRRAQADRTHGRSGLTTSARSHSARRQHNIPATGAIVFRAKTVLARGIAGVRCSHATAPVEERDPSPLGSNTKVTTAMVLATLVAGGKLTWTTTLADVFPAWRDSISADFRAATIDLLLSHRHFPVQDTDAKDFRSIPRLSGTDRAARRTPRLGVTRQTRGRRPPRSNDLIGPQI